MLKYPVPYVVYLSEDLIGALPCISHDSLDVGVLLQFSNLVPVQSSPNVEKSSVVETAMLSLFDKDHMQNWIPL